MGSTLTPLRKKAFTEFFNSKHQLVVIGFLPHARKIMVKNTVMSLPLQSLRSSVGGKLPQ